jgi:streptomycin 6-kinase
MRPLLLLLALGNALSLRAQNRPMATTHPKYIRIAWKDGKPALHVHGVVTDKNFTAYGGHILALEVGTGSVEITIVVHSQRLVREVDESTGAAVLGL